MSLLFPEKGKYYTRVYEHFQAPEWHWMYSSASNVHHQVDILDLILDRHWRYLRRLRTFPKKQSNIHSKFHVHKPYTSAIFLLQSLGDEELLLLQVPL